MILIDSRGLGRSTRDARPFGYDLMADDVIALMDQLSVRKASIVGWSDGGNIGLSIALRYPERLDRLFAFGQLRSIGRHASRRKESVSRC